MLLLDRGQTVQFEFFFTFAGSSYDPISLDDPKDIVVTIHRGDFGTGPIIDGPYSYLSQNLEAENNLIQKISSKDFVFNYTVPQVLFEGVYTVLVQTSNSINNISKQFQFQVKGEPTVILPVIAASEKRTVINYKPSYQDLTATNTSSILLIGHADGLQINDVLKITSIEHAVNLLGADISSPLLRGVFDAYSCGARDIFICSAAPMKEYVQDIFLRNNSSDIFDGSENLKTFYEKYYERLEETYSVISELDFIDIIVPLETSFINTGSVDFLTQLTLYCSDFHNKTGFVQMGVIGTRSVNSTLQDFAELTTKTILKNKYSIFSETGELVSDSGRYVVPIYGELIFIHPQLKVSYTATAAAAVSGMMASNSLSRSMIRQRIPGAYAMSTGDLSQIQYNALDAIGINIIYRGKRTRRAVPYEIYLSNEYTMANMNSVYSKSSQMRLVASVVSVISDLGGRAIGKFGYEEITSNFNSFLLDLKSTGAIIDFALSTYPDPREKGLIYFDINLISSLGLKAISLSLSSGPGA
jgi:hypothetical protein